MTELGGGAGGLDGLLHAVTKGLDNLGSSARNLIGLSSPESAQPARPAGSGTDHDQETMYAAGEPPSLQDWAADAMADGPSTPHMSAQRRRSLLNMPNLSPAASPSSNSISPSSTPKARASKGSSKKWSEVIADSLPWTVRDLTRLLSMKQRELAEVDASIHSKVSLYDKTKMTVYAPGLERFDRSVKSRLEDEQLCVSLRSEIVVLRDKRDALEMEIYMGSKRLVQLKDQGDGTAPKDLKMSIEAQVRTPRTEVDGGRGSRRKSMTMSRRDLLKAEEGGTRTPPAARSRVEWKRKDSQDSCGSVGSGVGSSAGTPPGAGFHEAVEVAASRARRRSMEEEFSALRRVQEMAQFGGSLGRKSIMKVGCEDIPSPRATGRASMVSGMGGSESDVRHARRGSISEGIDPAREPARPRIRRGSVAEGIDPARGF